MEAEAWPANTHIALAVKAWRATSFVGDMTGRTPPNQKTEPGPRRRRGALQGRRRATYGRCGDLQVAYAGARDALFLGCA